MVTYSNVAEPVTLDVFKIIISMFNQWQKIWRSVTSGFKTETLRNGRICLRIFYKFDIHIFCLQITDKLVFSAWFHNCTSILNTDRGRAGKFTGYWCLTVRNIFWSRDSCTNTSKRSLVCLSHVIVTRVKIFYLEMNRKNYLVSNNYSFITVPVFINYLEFIIIWNFVNRLTL